MPGNYFGKIGGQNFQLREFDRKHFQEIRLQISPSALRVEECIGFDQLVHCDCEASHVNAELSLLVEESAHVFGPPVGKLTILKQTH